MQRSLSTPISLSQLAHALCFHISMRVTEHAIVSSLKRCAPCYTAAQ